MLTSCWQLAEHLSTSSSPVDENKRRQLLSLLTKAEKACNASHPNPPDDAACKPWQKLRFLHQAEKSVCFAKGQQPCPGTFKGNVAVALRCFLSWRWTLETMCSMAKAVATLHSAPFLCIARLQRSPCNISRITWAWESLFWETFLMLCRRECAPL